MFIKEIYVERRNILKKKFKDGILLFLGNNESPMNYAGNTYQFRQDSSFLYYWGINEPNLAAVIDIKKNKEIIFFIKFIFYIFSNLKKNLTLLVIEELFQFNF